MSTTIESEPSAHFGQFSISEWCDTESILTRIDALLDDPVRPIASSGMERIHTWFDEHCEKSKQLATAAETVIPGGVQHNLAFNYPFPLAMASAEGAHLTDIDGNRYIDFLQAGGPTLLGSNYQPVREKVQALLDECGPVTGLLHEYEVKLAEEICCLFPSVEMFRMLGSGTEAVMAAIRVTRAHTGRKWIIKMGGGYHGWSDQMVYGIRVPGTGRMDAQGIPRSSTSHVQESFPHDLNKLQRRLAINRLRGGTAAVIVEPFGPESGTRPVTATFNAELRKLCDDYGVMLIFDEVVTGFRAGLSGAQGYFGVNPDLTIFGKCLTGGYPMAGGLGGGRDIMMNLAGGIGGGSKKVLVGGTLSANPLSCAAGYYSIQEMKRNKAAQKAGRAGDRLRAGLDDIINRLGLPFVAYNQGAIVHLQTSGVMLMNAGNPFKLLRLLKEAKSRKHQMEQFGAAYCAHGLMTLAGSRLYTSMADTDDIIDESLNRFEDVLKLAV